MAKRYYNLEKETKEYLKACEAKSIVNQTNIKTLNDFVINRKTRNLNTTFLANSPIVLNGLVLWFDAGVSDSYPAGGTVWKDLAGSNNGTLVNGPTFSKSNGGSIVFDGVNDYITQTSSGIITNNISVDIWFNTNSTKIYAGLLGSNITEKYEMLIKNASNLEISLSPGNYIQHNTILSINTWTNIIVSASNGVAWKVYKNGVDLGTPPTIVGTYQISGTGVSNIYQGTIRSDVSGTFAFSGNISLIKIYNRALSQNEITQNYNAMKGRFGL